MFHHSSCVAIECESCNGTGTVYVTRTRWVGGSNDGYQRTWEGDVRCEGCNGEGQQYVSQWYLEMVALQQVPGETPGTLAFNGHEVNAPGFTQDQFDRAMVPAFVDDLEVTETETLERYIVGYRNTGIGYHTSRERCGCKAGTAGTPYKHPAFLIAHLDIRQPAIAKQWAKLHQQRPARQVA